MSKNIYPQFGFKDEQDYKDNLYSGAYKSILADLDGKQATRVEMVKTCRSLIKKDKRIHTLASIMLSKWFEDSYNSAVKVNKSGFIRKLFKGGK